MIVNDTEKIVREKIVRYTLVFYSTMDPWTREIFRYGKEGSKLRRLGTTDKDHLIFLFTSKYDRVSIQFESFYRYLSISSIR